jgi:hypothetical protein
LDFSSALPLAGALCAEENSLKDMGSCFHLWWKRFSTVNIWSSHKYFTTAGMVYFENIFHK